MQSIRNKVFNLLRASERLFKIDMVYVAKNSAWTTLSFVVGLAASITTAVTYGNLLPRETYGIYSYLLSLGATLSFLTLSGTGIAVIRAVARGYENVVPLALRLQLKYNLVAMATVLAAAIYYAYKGNLLFASSLTLLAIAYPLAQAFHIYVQVLTGRKRFDLLTKINAIINIVSTLAVIITLFLTKNVLILVAVYTSISLLPNIIAYKMTTRNLDQSIPDEMQVKEMRRTSFHLTFAGLIGTAAQYIDKIVLFQVAGPAALAVYAFAIAGPDKLQSFIKNWLSIALPNLAQRSLEEIKQAFYRRIGFSLILGLALFLMYLFTAPTLFHLLLPRYLDSVAYSQVLAISLIVAPITIYIGGIFSQQNMLRGTYALSTGNQIVYILLVLILGWFWQIWGLIIASIISSIFNALYGIVLWEIETRRLMMKK